MAADTAQSYATMTSHLHSGRPAHEVASKVLRRARVSKMARVLQDRLALANIKIKHGWQNRSLESLESEIERELKRKRTDPNLDLSSDTSSVSGRAFPNGIPSSSPLTAPIFSDEIGRSGSSHGSAKRFRRDASWQQPESGSRTQRRLRAERPVLHSWKSAYQLPQSSPIAHHKYSRPATTGGPSTSFASHSSTIPDSPSASEEDDQDLPLHSFQISSTNLTSSPPKTPPPEVARSARLRSKAFNSPLAESFQGGKEGADLLLFFAASPSPAMRGNKGEVVAPTTPPTKHTPLPSSMMSTPGGQIFYGFGPNTPSNGFNFADFVNVTPSPAQGPWSKTPGTVKTPGASRDTRRKLNYDGLMPPPNHSPNIGSISRSSATKGAGLGMELGGELVS